MKGSPTQVSQEPALAGIGVARTDDDSCQLVAPHALLSCAVACGASKRKEEFSASAARCVLLYLSRVRRLGVPYVPCVCTCTRLGGLVKMRGSGHPLTMRMRMDMLM